MEDFIVSARKYRPQSFDTVVGQQSITKNLLQAIEQNHLAQAFLFCGPRGVGKTTCARILARTVNAHAMGDLHTDEDFAFNIFELDAASNNSVDDIRNLIDQVRVPPQVGKFKVYIIDEVHMLSTAAFNAFLKTLEEPPSYAIFILATTEKHKVLPTIISRCQVFNFSRIQIADMVGQLQQIAKNEGITAENDALHIIAEKADGAMRDALSIFDQMVSFAGNKLTYGDVIENLHVLDYDHYFRLVDCFLSGNRTDALILFNSILNKGFDGHNFINGLANHFRNLLFATETATANILEVGDNVKQRYHEQARKCSPDFMLRGLHLLSETDAKYKSSRDPRLLVELALLRLCGIGVGEKTKKKKPDPDGLSLPNGLNASSLPSPPAVSKTESLSRSAVSVPEAPLMEQEVATKQAGSNVPQPEAAPTHHWATDEAVPAPEQLEEPAAEKSDEVAPNALVNMATTTPQIETNPETEKTEEKTSPEANEKIGAPANARFNSRLSRIKRHGAPTLKGGGEPAGSSDKKSRTNDSQEAVNGGFTGFEGKRPVRGFNLAELWEVWDTYANKVREQDRQSYYTTLTKRRPIMREANKVELVLDNHVQLSDLEADKTNILTYLREELQNFSITLEGVVEEDDSSDDLHLYTPEERFKAMVESNPMLGKLRQQFDLDIEHD